MNEAFDDAISIQRYGGGLAGLMGTLPNSIYSASTGLVERAITDVSDTESGESTVGLRLLRNLARTVEHHEFDDGGYLSMCVESRPL